MLDRLNVLRSQAQRVIAVSDRSGLSGYFEDAIGLMDLLADQPGVKEIKFFLGTLRLALREKPPLLPGTGPESPAGPASEASPRQVKIFLVASEAGQAAAEELAGLLRLRKHGVENVQVTQSWDLVGELSEHPLVTARSTVERVTDGALVLVAEEATWMSTAQPPGTSSRAGFGRPPMSSSYSGSWWASSAYNAPSWCCRSPKANSPNWPLCWSD